MNQICFFKIQWHSFEIPTFHHCSLGFWLLDNAYNKRDSYLNHFTGKPASLREEDDGKIWHFPVGVYARNGNMSQIYKWTWLRCNGISIATEGIPQIWLDYHWKLWIWRPMLPIEIIVIVSVFEFFVADDWRWYPWTTVLNL